MFDIDLFSDLDAVIKKYLPDKTFNSVGLLIQQKDGILTSVENNTSKVPNNFVIDDRYNINWGYELRRQTFNFLKRGINLKDTQVETTLYIDMYIYYKGSFQSSSTKELVKTNSLQISNLFSTIINNQSDMYVESVDYDATSIERALLNNQKSNSVRFGLVKIKFNIVKTLSTCLTSCIPSFCTVTC